MGLYTREAARGCAEAQQRGVAQGRSVGLRMGLPGAAQGHSSVGLPGGTALWGCAAAQRLGLRRGAAAWGCAGEQQCGAA